MLTVQDATILLEFLDRVPTTGHQERAAMNGIVAKIYHVQQGTEPENQINVPEESKSVS